MTERDEKMIALAFLTCCGILGVGIVFGWLIGLIFGT